MNTPLSPLPVLQAGHAANDVFRATPAAKQYLAKPQSLLL
jgi:hypothetical protein